MDRFKKFSEDKLPDRSKFFIKDYLRAINVWNTLKKNLS